MSLTDLETELFYKKSNGFEMLSLKLEALSTNSIGRFSMVNCAFPDSVWIKHRYSVIECYLKKLSGKNHLMKLVF